MVTTLDGLPYPVKFRNQGALDAWQKLFKAHDWSQRMWDTWAISRAICLDCSSELCWHVYQRLHPHPLGQCSSYWPDTAFTTVVRWGVNIHFERKYGALIETTPALDTLPMHLLSPPFGAQYLHLNRATAEHFMTAEDHANQRWIEGIFCFMSKPSSSDDSIKFIPVIELIIINVAKDEGIRAQLLRGRKLTFVAPTLIHANRLGGQAPPAKAYGVTTGRVRPSRAAGPKQQTKQRIQPRDHA